MVEIQEPDLIFLESFNEKQHAYQVTEHSKKDRM